MVRGVLGLRVHNIPDEQRNPEGPHHLNVPVSVIGNSPTYSDISTSITGARPAKLVPGVNGYSTQPTESAYCHTAIGVFWGPRPGEGVVTQLLTYGPFRS